MKQQQEAALLAAFQKMHAEDQVLLLDFARMRAQANASIRPLLRLVGNEKAKH